MSVAIEPAALTIVIPARDEAETLGALLKGLKTACPGAEVLVVDDGSTDSTAKIAEQGGAKVLRHAAGLGNGAAIKTGIRAATRPYLVCMDADGQHRAELVPQLCEQAAKGYDCVVASRAPQAHATPMRRRVNRLYNHAATWITQQRVEDLTSGFRLMRTEQARELLFLLPNSFSYPTTLTIALMRTGRTIFYLAMPVDARQTTKQRRADIQIRSWVDGPRFALTIMKIGMLYAPQRVTLPIAGACGVLGLWFFSGSWLAASVVVFVLGLVAEQVSALHFRMAQDRAPLA